MTSIGRQELARRVARKTGQTQKDVNKILEGMIQSIQEALAEHQEVRLVGFGSFKVHRSGERRTVHPRTLKIMTIPEKDRVRFFPGKNLSEAVAGD